ncbi:MAG: hypothetical protein LUE14_04000 [Clostridiales bacterium]|nr:hypothetical protein [Clostridiales bacterium]
MAKKSYEKMSQKERMLLAIRQRSTRGMPRPVVFADKSKYDRKREKAAMRREGKE